MDETVYIPFIGGLDLKTANKAVHPRKLLRLENGTFDRPGEIRKRNGYTSLPTKIAGSSASITRGLALIASQGELLECDPTSLFSYSQSTGTWINKGAFVSTSVTQTPIIRNNYEQSSQDGYAASSGLEVFAWEDTQDGGGVRYLVRDHGTLLVPSTLISTTAIKPKVVLCGYTFCIIFIDSGTWRVAMALLPISTPQVPIVPFYVSDPAGSFALDETKPNYDAAAWGTGSSAQLYIALAAPASIVLAGYVATNLTSPLATTEITGGGSIARADVLNVFQDPNNTGPIVAWVNPLSQLRCNSYTTAATGFTNTSSHLLIATFDIISLTGTGITAQDGTHAGFVLFFGIDSLAGFSLNQAVVDASYTVSAIAFNSGSVAPSGKAFCYAGLAYCPVAHSSNAQNTYWVIDQNSHVVSKHLYQLGGGVPARTDGHGSAMLPETTQINETTWRLPLLQQDWLTSLPNTAYVPPGPNNPNNNPPAPDFDPATGPTIVYTQTGIVTNDLDFQDQLNSYLNTTLASSLHLSGGYISQYDGVSVAEHGFFLYPEVAQSAITYSTSGGGSIGLANGLPNVYWVCFTYEWTDNQGCTHVSAPSVPVSFTTDVVTGPATPDGSITCVIPTLRLTNKAGTPVIIKEYRTTANGSVFFFAGLHVTPAASGATNLPILNDKTVATVTVVDKMSDQELLGNQQLYTTGNVLENIEPNATAAMTVWNNRIWALDSTNPLTLWYTKAAVPGTPTQFSEFLTYNVDPRGGNVTALQAFDTLLVIFKLDSIYYISGDGADAAGNSSTLSTPILVTTDCGANNQRSIVVVPGGLIFQSPTKGFHLLPTGAAGVTYIGAPVEAYNDWTCASAQLIPDTNQVRFTMQPPNTESIPVALVYDYYAGQWSVFTPINAVDSCLWREQFTYVQPNGLVLQETPGKYSDNGQWISLLVQTAWLQFAQAQGWQRIRQFLALFTYESPCQLTVQCAYNFNESALQTNNWLPPSPGVWGGDSAWGGNPQVPTDSTVWGGTPGTSTNLRVLIGSQMQKSEAISVTLSDAPVPGGGDPGEGLALSGLTLRISRKNGSFRAGVTSTVD